MKHMKIILGEETVQLRLSAANLAQYAKDSGSNGNTLFAVMDALDDMDKRGALFTSALSFKGNENTVQSGFELMDLLADAEYGPIEVKELIVNLAVDAGIISKVELWPSCPVICPSCLLSRNRRSRRGKKTLPDR